MAYESKIRTVNEDRVTKNTTISVHLLAEIKLLATRRNTSFNCLIEEGMDYVLHTFKSPKDFTPPHNRNDRKQMGTTFSEKRYQSVKALAKKLHTKTNTLIEIGMEHVLSKYEKE